MRSDPAPFRCTPARPPAPGKDARRGVRDAGRRRERREPGASASRSAPPGPGSPLRLGRRAPSRAAFSPWEPGNRRLRGALPGPGRWHLPSFRAWGPFVPGPSAVESGRNCVRSARHEERLWSEMGVKKTSFQDGSLAVTLFSPPAVRGALQGAGKGGPGRGEGREVWVCARLNEQN